MLRRLLVPLLGSTLLLAAGATTALGKCEGPNPPTFCSEVVASLDGGGTATAFRAGDPTDVNVVVSQGEQPFEARERDAHLLTRRRWCRSHGPGHADHDGRHVARHRQPAGAGRLDDRRRTVTEPQGGTRQVAVLTIQAAEPRAGVTGREAGHAAGQPADPVGHPPRRQRHRWRCTRPARGAGSCACSAWRPPCRRTWHRWRRAASGRSAVGPCRGAIAASRRSTTRCHGDPRVATFMRDVRQPRRRGIRACGHARTGRSAAARRAAPGRAHRRCRQPGGERRAPGHPAGRVAAHDRGAARRGRLRVRARAGRSALRVAEAAQPARGPAACPYPMPTRRAPTTGYERGAITPLLSSAVAGDRRRGGTRAPARRDRRRYAWRESSPRAAGSSRPPPRRRSRTSPAPAEIYGRNVPDQTCHASSVLAMRLSSMYVRSPYR